MGILVSLAPCLLFPNGLYLEDERDASPHLLVLIGVFFANVHNERPNILLESLGGVRTI